MPTDTVTWFNAARPSRTLALGSIPKPPARPPDEMPWPVPMPPPSPSPPPPPPL
jgi:hypothetical protein